MLELLSEYYSYLLLLSSEDDDDFISMWIEGSGEIGVSVTWTSFSFKSNDSSLGKSKIFLI